MPVYVALLRSVNVIGHNKINMAALAAAASASGFSDVRTYIQSGNLLLRSEQDAESVAAALERVIAETFGLSVSALVRTAEELAAVAANPPFPTDEGDRLYVTFLRDVPASAAKLDPARSPPDRIEVRGREIYLLCPHGAGKSRYSLDYFERVLGTRGTARNWNTVVRLVEMAGDAVSPRFTSPDSAASAACAPAAPSAPSAPDTPAAR